VWWWTPPLFLLVMLGAVWLLSLWLIRFEKSPSRGIARFPSPGATVSAVLLVIAPNIAITAYGLDFPLAAAALVCTAMALWLTGSRRDGRG
jgi:peptidoglycan/LPS O-acetylase OafA/YrhL